MNGDKKKMTEVDWFILFQFAIFFDVVGWVLALGIDDILYGLGGILLNLLAGMIFLTFAMLWRNKGIGDIKFFTSLGKNFLVEEIPIVGTILPMWISFIYRARKSYIKASNSSLAEVVTGGSTGPKTSIPKIANKIA